MDKVYSNFGPLTTYTDSSHARDVLDMFRDMARMKEAQASSASPSSGRAASTSQLAEQAKGWMASGKTYLISVGGQHYDELDPSDQLKVLNYFINRLSSTNILANREDALRWAFRSMPNVFGVNSGEHAVQMGITILKEEAGKLKGSAAPSSAAPAAPAAAAAGVPETSSDDGSGLGSTGLLKSLIYAAQLLFQAGLLKKGDISAINNDPYGSGMKLIMDAIARGLASKSQMQREAAEMAKEIISSISQQVAAGGAGSGAGGAGAAAGAGAIGGAGTGAGAVAGAGGAGGAGAGAGGAGGAGAGAGGAGTGAGGAGGAGAGGGFLALIGQGLQAIIDMLKSMPNAPKAADQVLLEMALATDPKYWFPNGQVAESGFYGPYLAADGKYWAEVDYDGQTNQFVFSGRYTVIPNDAVRAIQQASAQGG